ncbi:MAG: glycosyltransferase [Flavobacteriaceae bacterium]
MKQGVSIIIRNKNEADYLSQLLNILTDNYANDYDEIIIVDNNSTDDSIVIAEKFNCRIITIDEFSYGRACNLGIVNAKNEYCVFLSSHSVPFGSDFFKNVHTYFKKDAKIAGLRFCKNIVEAKSFYENKSSNDNLNAYGLMNAASALRKSVWEKVKFDEEVKTSEDKIWTRDISKLGYEVQLIPSIFFYINTRNFKNEIKRYRKHKKAMEINPDIYSETVKINSLYYFIREIYRAFVIFLRRVRYVIAKLWVDITT